MISRALYLIFKQGSRTFFYTSRSFPRQIRDDVFTLYGFVRKTDDFVDAIPQRSSAFFAFRRELEASLNGQRSCDPILISFMDLVKRKELSPAWIRSFLDAMEMDITRHFYPTLSHLEQYMYGSAEVVGMMMARIMGLPSRAYRCARILGRAMQYINFIRDIREDLDLGRIYLPQSFLRRHGLVSLEYSYVNKRREEFQSFIRHELQRFHLWRSQAQAGFRYIPAEYLVSIKTASDMYAWTAEQINREPMVVYRRKVIPPIALIKKQILKNSGKINN